MRLLTTSEEHFYATDASAIYSRGLAAYPFWSRYSQVFSAVEVIARVKAERFSEKTRQRADGEHVSFCVLPDFTGAREYLRVRRQARATAQAAVARCDAYLLRVPGLVSQMVWREIVRAKKPYAVEVLGDPWRALGPGTWPNISRPVFRVIGTQQMKRICAGASALHYVTAATLQKRYPPRAGAYVDGFSDVSLGEALAPGEILAERLQRIRALPWAAVGGREPLRIGFVGSFARMYKGADVLLRAVEICAGRDLRLFLQFVGDGRHLEEMKQLAARLGLAASAHFSGRLPPGNEIFGVLDSIDLFVLPSRTEGMPRALLEAMARGCPCIGSDVGGIPELLEPEEMFPVADEHHLAALIMRVASDAERLAGMSERNAAKSRQFAPGVLDQKRVAFLEAVKQISRR
ncbi:MAG TPA: glycosyltransferase family 4 protein [Candidatus Acidoferrum sp.]|jgi:glycosyltransferase involved in cell wall biosynthesis